MTMLFAALLTLIVGFAFILWMKRPTLGFILVVISLGLMFGGF